MQRSWWVRMENTVDVCEPHSTSRWKHKQYRHDCGSLLLNQLTVITVSAVTFLQWMLHKQATGWPFTYSQQVALQNQGHQSRSFHNTSTWSQSPALVHSLNKGKLQTEHHASQERHGALMSCQQILKCSGIHLQVLHDTELPQVWCGSRGFQGWNPTGWQYFICFWKSRQLSGNSGQVNFLLRGMLCSFSSAEPNHVTRSLHFPCVEEYITTKNVLLIPANSRRNRDSLRNTSSYVMYAWGPVTGLWHSAFSKCWRPQLVASLSIGFAFALCALCDSECFNVQHMSSSHVQHKLLCRFLYVGPAAPIDWWPLLQLKLGETYCALFFLMLASKLFPKVLAVTLAKYL